ncbi:hypothetical protein P4284_16150 [Bacillus swezeyi]|uniref:hypothetical protein n=1 Tax=Bacillus swezeyi TaxID=1925020 RepID=UPI002E24CF23|nr:hypothetical protein [Bacillus swezeyi]
MKNKNMTDVEIAEEQLYCDKLTLRYWKTRHGLIYGGKKPPKKSTIEEWQEKRKQGLSEREIAKSFGYRTSRHYFLYKEKIGMPLLRKKKIERTPELLDEIKGYLDQGLLIKEITEKISVEMSSCMVGKIIREEGLRSGKSGYQKSIRENRESAKKGA